MILWQNTNDMNHDINLKLNWRITESLNHSFEVKTNTELHTINNHSFIFHLAPNIMHSFNYQYKCGIKQETFNWTVLYSLSQMHLKYVLFTKTYKHNNLCRKNHIPIEITHNYNSTLQSYSTSYIFRYSIKLFITWLKHFTGLGITFPYPSGQ